MPIIRLDSRCNIVVMHTASCLNSSRPNGAKMVVSDSYTDFAELVAKQRFEEFRERQATLESAPSGISLADIQNQVGVQEQTIRRLAVDECLKLGIEAIEWTISAEEKVSKYRTKQCSLNVVRKFFQDLLEYAYRAELLIDTIDTSSQMEPLRNLDRFHECLCEIAAFVRSLERTDLLPSLSVRERVNQYETQQANLFQNLGTVRPPR